MVWEEVVGGVVVVVKLRFEEEGYLGWLNLRKGEDEEEEEGGCEVRSRVMVGCEGEDESAGFERYICLGLEL